jgi:hypothetical protein
MCLRSINRRKAPMIDGSHTHSGAVFMIDGSHTHSGVFFMIDGSHTHSGAFLGLMDLIHIVENHKNNSTKCMRSINHKKSSTMCMRSINHKKAPLCV